MTRYLLTPSLLSAWQWFLSKNYEGEPNASKPEEQDKWDKMLRRAPFEPTEAMRAGIRFEKDVYRRSSKIPRLDEEEYSEEYWACVDEIAEKIKGAVLQVKTKRELVLPSRTFLVYGRLDALRANTIFDIKFTGSQYEIGKYISSPQHPFYMYTVPEAQRFVYLTSNGKVIWLEEYQREATRDIHEFADEFDSWLRSFPQYQELYDVNWIAF